MRVIGYVRLSRSTEESTSVTRQRQVLTQVADARGWELVGIEEDPDTSATRSRLDRPGLNAVRRALAEDRADAIFVWRLDRLARSVVDFGTLLDEGLQIISATEPLDTTSSMGRAMAEILQVFAAMEARAIGARVSSSRRHLPTVGRFPGGATPYGYRPCAHPSGVGRGLEPDPAEAAVVRRMVDEVLEGRSLYAITGGLNADGLLARRGKSWQVTSVATLLRGDAILGRMKSGGQLVRDERGLPVQVWQPLVGAEDAARLRARLHVDRIPGRGAESSAGRLRASRMLSGIIRCHSCGEKLTARHTAHPTLVARYICVARTRGRVCAQPVAGGADRADAVVEERFLAAVGRLPVVEVRELMRDDVDTWAVEAAIADTTDELRHPDADLGGLIERLTTLRAERDRLAALPVVPTVQHVATGETFGEVWARGDYLARRALLMTAGVSVTLHPAVSRGLWSDDRVEVAFPPDETSSYDD
jgi:site-specific DNA recombinase